MKAESDAPAARPSAPDVGLAADPLSTAASSKASMPKRAKKAAAEPAESPEEARAEGAARKHPRRDADRAAAHDDELLCDWIDALAWLETDAANAAAPAQVRRLRELAAALGKEPVTRVGVKDAVQHFHVRLSLSTGVRKLGDV